MSIVRIFALKIAAYIFAPTPLSEKDLQEEKAHGRIFVTGNTGSETFGNGKACGCIVRAINGKPLTDIK